MSNPFDDSESLFFVVVNDEGQHALWPEHAALPAGWRPVHGAAGRSSCLDYVNVNWTDMRPLGLVAHLEGAPSSERGAGR
ncbi:mycobactin NRPS accessory protein MbtH [Streptosporangium fragile]|uniref:Mycobactin NRPS accessory protein MbtH n=1 Tax=Streptosporangium fragile TaxID=46186 RepID=A0ABP6IM22_9ACTN